MFRKMRLAKQELSRERTEEILRKGTSGVLALSGDNGYPYAVPVNYYYEDGKIYMHGAKSGHKIDSIMRNEKASFCVKAMEKVVQEKYTTFYQSVIAFGKIRIMQDEKEIREAIEKFAAWFCPDFEEGRKKEIDREWNLLCMFVLEIEHMTGKQAMDLLGN